jgi:putative nucleotidyltransferase with HDIG domain
MKTWFNVNSVIFALVLFIAFITVLYPAWTTTAYDVQEGTVTNESIVAQQRLKDELATNRARNIASSKVKPVYQQVDLQTNGIITDLMSAIEEINNDPDINSDIRVQMYRDDLFPTLHKTYYERKLKELRDSKKFADTFLTDVTTVIAKSEYKDIPFKVYYKIPLLSTSELRSIESVMLSASKSYYRTNRDDVSKSRDVFIELVNSSEMKSRVAREITVELLRYVAVPNYYEDQVASKQARQVVRDRVAEQWIEKGTVIVPAGTVIDAAVYQRLVDLRIVSESNSFATHFGIWLFALVLVTIVFVILRERLRFDHQRTTLLMLLSIIALAVIMMRLTYQLQEFTTYDLSYIMPLSFASVMIALLYEVRTAYVFAFIFSVLVGAMFHADAQTIFDYRNAFFNFVVCIMAIYTSEKVTERSAMLRTGLMIAIFGAVTLIAFALLERTDDTSWWFIEPVAYSFLNGALTSVLILGLMPIFETVFKVLSNMKLIELGNQNHPLLQRLMSEGAGTYHHSMMVANLASAAAERVGANSLLCRVSAYYHDVGKLVRPTFFAENNMTESNPHDPLDPNVSRAILISHVSDGVELLKKHKLPSVIVEIVAQHHGTTLIRYFYNKALKIAKEEASQAPESLVDIPLDSYRYPGPKPQTMEAVILLIADSVEAAVRSLKLADHEQIDRKIDEIIMEKLDDKQFHDCHVTLKELNLIADVMKQVLHGTVHERPQYPSLQEVGGGKSDDSSGLGE